MKQLPNSYHAPVIRTDFSNDQAWETILRLIRAPVYESPGAEPYFAYVEFIDDPEFQDLGLDELLNRLPADFSKYFLFVVDRDTTAGPEFPILVVDIGQERGRTFRALPSEIQGIENNLSIANMDFFEFADNVDPDGVFRGFGRE